MKKKIKNSNLKNLLPFFKYYDQSEKVTQKKLIWLFIVMNM